jgi:hypothetical protein
MNDEDIFLMFAIFKQVSPKISENVQVYNESESSRFGHVVKYNKGKIDSTSKVPYDKWFCFDYGKYKTEKGKY